jgi:excisionase family DNA binding protein
MSSAVYLPLGDCNVLTVSEFAKAFRLSENAVRRGIDAGRIPGAKIGNSYRAYVAATRSFTEDDAAGLPEEAE